MKRCNICYRQSENDFCPLHELALKSLCVGFREWKKRVESITEKHFLEEMINHPLAGSAIKDMATYILESDDRFKEFIKNTKG